MKEFSWDEILDHNKESNCWLVANNKVYDVTKFINHHPGGRSAIINHAGQDCTYDFNFHSKKAKLIWNKYLIGRVKDTSEYCCKIC